MPAKSIAQQRAAKMAQALQDSRQFTIEVTPGTTAWGPAAEMAASMSPQQLSDFSRLKPGAPYKKEAK